MEELPLLVEQLITAIKNGDRSTFDSVLCAITTAIQRTDGKIQLLDKDGFSPLHVAVEYRRKKMLSQLLHSRNALSLDVNVKSGEGLTAWDYARKYKFKSAQKLLIDQDCDCTCHSTQRSNEDQQHAEDMDIGIPKLTHPIGGDILQRVWPQRIYKKAVTKTFKTLTTSMNPITIIPQLVEKEVLSQDEAQNILDRQTTAEKSICLLTLMPRKGVDGYRVLFTALWKDPEHLPHKNLAEELVKKCQEVLLHLESMSPLLEITKEESTQGDEHKEEFHHVDTIYTGSDPLTAASRTFDSLVSQYSTNLPDSGFRSGPPTPHRQDSGDQHSSQQNSNRVISTASNFIDVSVTGKQSSSELPYPTIINTVIKSKVSESSKADLHPKPAEDPGTSSRGVYCLTRNRSSMVLPKPAFQGILEEISDVEKDECKDGMNLCQEDVEEDTSVSSDEDDTDKHRTLSPQILANSPIFLLPDVTPTTICVATSPLSNSSQPSSVTSQPINIPSRNSSFVSLTSNVIRSSSFQCEQTRRRISSSESSSTTSDSSSEDNTDSTHHADSTHSAASTPKYLIQPSTKWQKFKNFLVTSNTVHTSQDTENMCEQSNIMVKFGVKLV